ncbi:FAD:protein FMN transferase [Microbacterium sp. NEAU-LLC]|uniref:FAD:protein FMN transferase n=1 Tax=Microbacterium helvum TaxID=2773713 RepID=A0ABR8NR23_9MICO|nr:FAD:protein FMN transferase [Microbacterium helvum]MBD3942418.1 FAD:protein FMN transferase [Microbacterium helvum]
MAASAPWRFDAIGTTWEIATAEPLRDATRDAVCAVIDGFDRGWSRFRADSVVCALARGGGSVPAPPDAALMLDAFVTLDEATDGAVNPLVAASLDSLGYDAAYSLRDRGALAAPAAWRELVTWTDDTLALALPATIDVGALGKGRLVDLVLDVVRDAVDGDVVVDASGDLAVRGRAERVGLEHPFDPRRAIGVWEVKDAALCASATGRRSWPSASGGTLHHVIDARTGQPVRTYAATWAVAADAMTADAVATALFFDGGPRLAHEWGAEWVRMTTDGRVEWSPGCRADLFVGADRGARRTVPAPRPNSLER